jgi:hypothetical protein
VCVIFLVPILVDSRLSDILFIFFRGGVVVVVTLSV